MVSVGIGVSTVSAGTPLASLTDNQLHGIVRELLFPQLITEVLRQCQAMSVIAQPHHRTAWCRVS